MMNNMTSNEMGRALIYDGSADPYYKNPLKIYGDGRMEYPRILYHYSKDVFTDIHSIRDFRHCLIWSYTVKRSNTRERYTKIYHKTIDNCQTIFGSSDCHVIANNKICSFVPIDFTYRIADIMHISGKYTEGYKYANNPLAFYVSVYEESKEVDMTKYEIDFGKLLVMPSVSSIFKLFFGFSDMTIWTIE